MTISATQSACRNWKHGTMQSRRTLIIALILAAAGPAMTASAASDTQRGLKTPRRRAKTSSGRSPASAGVVCGIRRRIHAHAGLE
jgi:hypothetical protein